MKNGSSTAYFNDSAVAKQNIKLLAQTQLSPNIGATCNDQNFQTRITSTLQRYDSMKRDLNSPCDPQKGRQHVPDRTGALDYESLFKLCLSISKSLGKPAAELSHEDIILNYEEPLRDVFGVQNIGAIFNQYIKRWHNNELNEWKSKEKKANIQFWSENEFRRRFGERPWVVVNQILEDTFDGKFQFSIPDEESHSYAYQAELKQTDNQQPVAISALSSGEKTLLWLALTLFNSQYYNSEIVNTPEILLIDEADVFLHPGMVIKMYSTIGIIQ